MNEHTFFQNSIIFKMKNLPQMSNFLLIDITVVGCVHKDIKTKTYVLLSQFKNITRQS